MRFTVAAQPVETFGVEEESDFTIDASGKMFHILMAGLYSNKIQSIVRETIANAHDGHVAANCTDKAIDVHAPTSWEPYYSVRDFGSSMTHEFVMKVYTTLGKSTKDSGNDMVGSFGLGSKSPFSYTTEFSVTCWLDGECRVYTAFIAEDGRPKLVLNARMQSDEPRGVMVSLPVQVEDYDDFTKAIRDVSIGHTCPITCNKTLPTKTTISSSFGIEFYCINGPNTLDKNLYVSVGPVWYPVAVDLVGLADSFDYWKSGVRGAVLHLPIGEVDVTPSRESLSYTPRTKAAIRKVLEDRWNDAEQAVEGALATFEDYTWDFAIEAQRLLRFYTGIEYFVLDQILGDKPGWDQTMVPSALREQIIHFTQHSRVTKEASLKRWDGTCIFVHDPEKDGKLTMLSARIKHFLATSEFKTCYVFETPSHLTVREQSERFKRAGMSREDRVKALKGRYDLVKQQRKAIPATIEQFGCPYVVLPDDLPLPPKKVKAVAPGSPEKPEKPISFFIQKFGAADSWGTARDLQANSFEDVDTVAYVTLVNRAAGPIGSFPFAQFEEWCLGQFDIKVQVIGLSASAIPRMRKALTKDGKAFICFDDFLRKKFEPLLPVMTAALFYRNKEEWRLLHQNTRRWPYCLRELADAFGPDDDDMPPLLREILDLLGEQREPQAPPLVMKEVPNYHRRNPVDEFYRIMRLVVERLGVTVEQFDPSSIVEKKGAKLVRVYEYLERLMIGARPYSSEGWIELVVVPYVRATTDTTKRRLIQMVQQQNEMLDDVSQD